MKERSKKEREGRKEGGGTKGREGTGEGGEDRGRKEKTF